MRRGEFYHSFVNIQYRRSLELSILSNRELHKKNNEKGQLAAKILRRARATSPLWTRIYNWLPFKCCYHNAETATLRHFQPWNLGRALSLVIDSSQPAFPRINT